ncbi:MAG: DUF882 domain-containing protein [Candidatus Tectomicrobia bacterium]
MTQLAKPGLTLIEPRQSRRRVLKSGVLAAGAWFFLPRLARAHKRDARAHERTLALYNCHTGESLKRVYWFRGQYLSEALTDINHILRDHRANETRSIDLHLLDLLCTIQRKLAPHQAFHVISAYRTPATNAMLRRHSKGVAKHSLHMQGKAIDIRLPGYASATVRRVALALRRGGVGYYPRAGYVHVDTGQVRSWRSPS